MKNIYFITILFAVIILSCKDSVEEPVVDPQTTIVQTDSVEMEKVDTVLTSETLRSFNQSGFTDYAKSKVEGFDWSKFRLVNVYKEDSMVTSSFAPDDQYYKIYGPFLKYSPDSSRFIDLDSYNIDIKSNARGQLTGNELGPDNEVSMIEPDTRQKTRLVFLGPGGSVEDGAWIDNETLVLAGVHENQDGKTKSAVVWKYHVPTNTFYVYEMPDPVSAEKLMGEWRDRRLKTVEIK